MSDRTPAPCYERGVASPRAAGDRAGWIAGGVLAVALTLLGWVRHRNGWSGIDMAVFDQGVWKLSRGEAPDVTVNGRSLFADHVSPILVLFAPLYRLATTPVWLIAAQAGALGAGLPAIRRLARRAGASVAAFTIAYVLSAPLLAAGIADIHPSTMAVAPLAWLLVGFRGDSRRPVVAAIAGIAVCRADLGWVVAATALVAPRRHRPLVVALGLGATAVGYLVPSLLGSEATFPVHYGHLGDSPGDVLSHPWRLLSGFTAKDLQTVALWLLPTGFATALAPRWLAATLLAGAPVLLSQWPGTQDPFTHYGAPLVPLALGGAITVLARQPAPPSGRTVVSPRLVLAGAVAATALAGPLSPKAPEEYSAFDVLTANFDGHLDDALAAVGPGAPVAAVPQVLAQLTHRDLAYGWPIPFRTVGLSILYGGADPEVAARIRVVIAGPGDRAEMESYGFRVEDVGPLSVGRR